MQPEWLSESLVKDFFLLKVEKENLKYQTLFEHLHVNVNFCIEHKLFQSIDESQLRLFVRKINTNADTDTKDISNDLCYILSLPETEIVKYNKLWRICTAATHLKVPNQQYIMFDSQPKQFFNK